MAGAIRQGLRVVFRTVIRIYFRDIEVSGDVPDRATGGRLFGANHVNGLVDPILVLTQAPCAISPIAKSTLWSIPGLQWLLDAADAVPIVRKRDNPNKSAEDNDAVFARVADHLAHGGNILIFPEGTSHNEPHLLALRSGAGRMLARAADASTDLTYQAVALEFDAREIFRSRVLVLFGPVRHVRDAKAENDADVARVVTETLQRDLSELLVEGETWEERTAVVHVAKMFANDARERSLEGVNRFGRRIEQAKKILATAEPAVVRDVEWRVGLYRSALEDAEVTDEAVARVVHRKHGDPLPTVPYDKVVRAAILVLALPLALLGMAVYWIPYRLVRIITNRFVSDPDVTSTYKLGAGLLLFPSWAGIGVAIAATQLSGMPAFGAILAILTAPFAALGWLDRSEKLGSRAKLLVPDEMRRERLEELADMRRALMTRLETARAKAER